jgi:hypothetical protein
LAKSTGLAVSVRIAAFKAFLNQREELLRAQAWTPTRYRRALDRSAMLKEIPAIEQLTVRVLNSSFAQYFVAEVVHGF